MDRSTNVVHLDNGTSLSHGRSEALTRRNLDGPPAVTCSELAGPEATHRDCSCETAGKSQSREGDWWLPELGEGWGWQLLMGTGLLLMECSRTR